MVHSGLVVTTLTLNDFATFGWAVARNNRVFRLSNGRWTEDAQLERMDEGGIWFVQAARKGNSGWALTQTHTLRYTDTSGWKVVDRRPNLRFIWSNNDGTRAWSASFDSLYALSPSGRWVSGGANDFRLDRFVLNDSASRGWGLDLERSLYRFSEGQWQPFPNSMHRFHHLQTAANDAAVGVDSLSRLWRTNGERWEFEADLSPVGDVSAVHAMPDGTAGWVLGDEGLFHWARGRAPDLVLPPDNRVLGIWMNDEETLGYLYGRDGILARYANGRWTNDGPLRGFADSTGSEDFTTLAMSSDGTRGWALGRYGTAAVYDQGAWKQEPIPQEVADVSWWQLALNEDATGGWAVGGNGAVMELSDGRWSVHVYNFSDLFPNCVLAAEDGSAVFVAFSGAFYKFENKIWKRLRTPWGGASPIQCIAVDPSTEEFLVSLGDHQSVARYRPAGLTLIPVGLPTSVPENYLIGISGRETSLWLQATQPASPDQPSLRKEGTTGVNIPPPPTVYSHERFWISSNAERAFAVEQFRAAFLVNGRWIEEQFPERYETPPSLWIDRSGEHGWMVGSAGTIMKIENTPFPRVTLSIPAGSSLDRLAGEFELRSSGTDSLFLNGIEISGCSEPALTLAGTSAFTAVTQGGTVRFSISNNVREHIVSNFKNASCTLRFDLAEPAADGQRVPFAYVTRVYILGRPSWQYAAMGVALILLVNLGLVLASTRNRWLRNVVLSSVGSNVVGLVVGKYLVVEPLIRFVRPIRLAMFRDYRRGVRDSNAMRNWTSDESAAAVGREYIPPDVSVRKDAPGTTAEGPSWSSTFERIRTAPRERVWLVKGPSGLGKTALLERWLSVALERGSTPVLLRLGSESPALAEATAAFAQYGDIRVTEETARTLLEAGGFILLLDGANEDRNPAATRDLIRRTTRRNTIVVSSQHDPEWVRDVRIEPVELAGFGREQLLHFVASDWVDRLLRATHLQQALRLPYTARLIAEYIKRTDRIPDGLAEVYGELRERLPVGNERLNLDLKAWEMFRENQVLLPDVDGLSSSFLDRAVETGILTVTASEARQRYRFAHERIHRFIVACYLKVQEPRPLKEWQREIRTGLPRSYWKEVLEIWSEMYVFDVLRGEATLASYEMFLRQVGKFDVPIFRALYHQADRWVAERKIVFSSDFVARAARISSSPPGDDR